MSMKMKTLHILICLMMVGNTAQSQYQTRHGLISNGTGPSTSDNLTVLTTLGQPALSLDPEFLSGFWHIVNPLAETCTLSGDASGDLIVNIIDIVYIVGFILETNPVEINESCADCNGDFVINVIDIVCIVEIIFNAE